MSLLPEYEEQVIKEGFLCPVCLEDFAGINELTAHFTSGIHQEEEDHNTASGSESWEHKKKIQTIGSIRSHYSYFKEVRDGRLERYEIETNLLLDRLEKLTASAPTEEGRRREYERQVCLWVSDEDVKLCPSCGKSFHFTRRKHHCRLCGAIMCQNCSKFIDFQKAKKLIDPSTITDSDPDGDESTTTSGSNSSSASSASPSSNSFSQLGNGLLRRRGSTSSLFTVVTNSGLKDRDTSVRMCFDCKILMDRRDIQIDEKRKNPIICQFYSRLKFVMSECERLLHDYLKMHMSLSLGESKYELQEAQVLRIQLIKYSEEIDLISRRICSLGVDDASPPSVSQLQLQAKIRMAATNFLKHYMLGLQSLPTEEEIEKLKKMKRIHSAQLRQMEQVNQQNSSSMTSTSSGSSGSMRPQQNYNNSKK